MPTMQLYGSNCKIFLGKKRVHLRAHDGALHLNKGAETMMVVDMLAPAAPAIVLQHASHTYAAGSVTWEGLRQDIVASRIGTVGDVSAEAWTTGGHVLAFSVDLGGMDASAPLGVAGTYAVTITATSALSGLTSAPVVFSAVIA